ncbi:MAG: polysaccharide pyruvyl transferase family protein [Sphingobium sp.]
MSSGNLGVGALTVANMAIARSVADEIGVDVEFLVMGMRDGNAPRLPNCDAPTYVLDRRSLLSPGGFWSAVKQLDCMLDIGAGDSFAEIYGPKRFLFLWLTKVQTIFRKVPLILSPQTIGPFARTPYRQLASFALRGARAVVARDTMSYDVARTMAPRANVLLAVDVAFVLPFDSQTNLRAGPKLRIGINASGLLLHEAEIGRNRFGLSYDYGALTRRLISSLVARPDVEVHLIAHATSKDDASDDDARWADRLAQEFPTVIRVPNFVGPSEAKSYISGLDFLVSGRMHACIGAYSAGTPVVPLAYSRKFSGLFGMLNYSWMVPVKGMDELQVFDFIVHALKNRSQLSANAASGMTGVSAMLDAYREILRQTFAAIVATRQ